MFTLSLSLSLSLSLVFVAMLCGLLLVCVKEQSVILALPKRYPVSDAYKTVIYNQREREREPEREKWNSKTSFYKDCSIGLVKTSLRTSSYYTTDEEKQNYNYKPSYLYKAWMSKWNFIQWKLIHEA